MADVEVHYDFVVKELQGRQKSENLKLNFYPNMKHIQTNKTIQKQADMIKVMEDVQFNSALLRNGILAERTEFELARQFDDTLAESENERLRIGNSMNVKTEINSNISNLKQIDEPKKQRRNEDCLGQASSIASVYSCAEEGNACESSSAKDSGISDLTVAAIRRLSALVIHNDKDFEIMSVQEQDLNDRSSNHSRKLGQLELAKSVEKCREMFELDGSYFSFDGHMRTSTPVESLQFGLEERESDPRSEKYLVFPKRSKNKSNKGDARASSTGTKIKEVLTRGSKKVGDGLVHGFVSFMAAIL